MSSGVETLKMQDRGMGKDTPGPEYRLLLLAIVSERSLLTMQQQGVQTWPEIIVEEVVGVMLCS